MWKRIIMSFFAMALLVFDGGVDVKAEARKTLSEIDKKLKLLNKPAIKSIKVYFSIISFFFFFLILLGIVPLFP